MIWVNPHYRIAPALLGVGPLDVTLPGRGTAARRLPVGGAPLGVVHVLAAGQSPEHRWVQQACKPAAILFAGAPVRQRVVRSSSPPSSSASEVIVLPQNCSSRRGSEIEALALIPCTARATHCDHGAV
jgi:hypothetical protein